MLRKINNKLTNIITPVLIGFIIFFAGCSSSSVETIDGKTMAEDHKDIKEIYSFKLKDGSSYYDSLYTIYLNFANSSRPEIVYNGPVNNNDSTGKVITTALFKNFSIYDVASAKVMYKRNSGSLPVILGVIAATGVILFIFWANGERNKRK